jgi:hypothetical protein
MPQVVVNGVDVADDDDAWDDTALLQAYDDAIKGIVRGNKRVKLAPRSSSSQSATGTGPGMQNGRVAAAPADGAETESNEEVEEGFDGAQDVSPRLAHLPLPGAATSEQIDEDLRSLLQAYFDAGVTLGRYMQKQAQKVSTSNGSAC